MKAKTLLILCSALLLGSCRSLLAQEPVANKSETPTPAIKNADANEPTVLWNRTYTQRDSGPLDMDIYLPPGEGPFPGVLVVHGGAWRIGSRSQLAAIAMNWARHGYTAAAVSYRLAPKDKFPAQIYDVQAAVRWLRSHAGEIKLDPNHIGGFGYSAGGHLVALLGTLDDDDLREEGLPANAPSARLQAVLAGGAPCDFRVLAPDSSRLAYWLGGTPAEKPDLYREASPATFITSDDPPMFFFHGETDLLVPINSPRRMVKLLGAAGVTAQMHTISNTGHILAMFDLESLEQALAFADKYLKEGANIEPARAGPPSASATPRAGPSSIPPSKATSGDGNAQ